MKLIHNSRDAAYRTPYGAVTAQTNVALRVRLEDADLTSTTVTLRTWIDGKGESLYPMAPTEGDAGLFSIELPCDSPCIIWYSFIARTSEGSEIRLGAPQGRTGGQGVNYDYAEVPSFQITVYKHREIRPSWYENGMVYQIFPDRYARDEDWKARSEAALAIPHKGIPRKLVEDWAQPPVYKRADDMSIAQWDFYGGSLKGIEKDLPRLKELGFTAIYLNPIFQAESNHRYDTGDYLKIDPMLGTEQDFTDLCKAAEKLGISIILDGVFNHTGDDSLYFNRYGNYPGTGAWQSENSPWREAYHFAEDGSYESWWGISNMPDLNEDSEKVKELILGEDGVIRHWLRAGAHGWRLDVADELSDEFIEAIRAAALAEKPDSLLLGEVWEDASNKISYSKLRRYLQGSELDAAMNYPFRDMVIGFLMGGENAYEAAETIEGIRENYPTEALRCSLNLMGSHDKPRIASVLGGAPVNDTLPEEKRGSYRLSPENMGLAKGRFWLATLIQMTLPGVPSIYYGDEFGLEGLSDPGNRRTMPTPDMPRDNDFLTIFKNASALRRALPFLVDGTLEAFALNEDVLAYTRKDEKTGESATILINRSNTSTHTVTIPALGECATDVIGGRSFTPDEQGKVTVPLWQFGSAIVYFHDEVRLQEPLETGAGVICHITSVPTDDGKPGTLGAASLRFVDHLAQMGFKYWQMLPVNPTDSFRSPYAGPSAFAGNIDLLPQSLPELKDDFDAWRTEQGPAADPEYASFKERNSFWLDSYAAYMAVKKSQGMTARQTWPKELCIYNKALLDDPRFASEAQFQMYLQYRFDSSWRELASYAHKKGISIIGDIPMYVSDDSADAWAHPELFWLSDTGKAIEISGAPPDNFAPEGQKWGNPTFRWDVMQRDGYTWWLARLERAFDLYDRVRLDHFLGFHAYFSIPADKECADGRWLAGPGINLFKAAYDKLGPLRFIAEDLGYLTPGVRALCATCGFLGMDVLEFSDYDIRQGVHPREGQMLYTSTHDTSTLLGYVGRAFEPDDKEAARKLTADLIHDALTSDAPVVMMPLQDVLLLDDTNRMNTPGVAEGNWSWQASEAAVEEAQEGIARLLRETRRASGN